MSRTPLKMSLLIEQRQERDIQTVDRQKKIRKRLFIFVLGVFCIVLAFSITAGVISHQDQSILREIVEVNKLIQIAQQSINYQAVNKTIKFAQEDQLQGFSLSSYAPKQTENKSIRNMDLKQTNISLILNIKLPSLTNLILSSNVRQIVNCTFGVKELDLSSTEDLQVLNLDKLDVQIFDTRNTNIHTILQTTFCQAKQIRFQNQQLSIVIINSPKLQKLVLNSTNKIVSMAIKQSNLTQVVCDNCSGLAIYIAESKLTSLKGLCNFKNLQIQNSPVTEISCKVFPILTKIELINVPITRLELVAPKISDIWIHSCPIQSISIIKESKPLQHLELRNISIPGFVNFTLQFVRLALQSNPNLTQISNNQWNATTMIQCFACQIQKIDSNMFPNIGSIMIQGFERGKLREYTNNKNPNLTFLELSFNELVNITGNDFSKLSQLLIGNNYLGEIGIENLITKNTWTKGTLTVINITNNNINNKTEAKTRLHNFFPGVQIYI